MEEFGVNNCDSIQGKPLSKSTVLTVDGVCRNFYYNDGTTKKLVWYKAVKTTSELNRPGVDPAPAGPKCVDNKIDTGDDKGKQCIEFESKPKLCS